MDLLRKLYEFVLDQLHQASAAPASGYNEGFVTALEGVKDMAEELAWEEGEQLGE